MNRAELYDNLAASRQRGELVTLTLRPTSGYHGDVEMTGRILAIAVHYTGRQSIQVVLIRNDDVPMVIGLSMIKDFQVGQPRRGTGGDRAGVR